MLHICAASWQEVQHGPIIHGVAVLEEPGLYSVITFIKPDGKVYEKTEMWYYSLWPHKGAISIPTGVSVAPGTNENSADQS